jgi:V/A-type H+-transporting ATPase subunit I
MFRPRAMTKVDLLVLQRDLPLTLRALAAARIIHLHRIEATGLEGVRRGGYGLDLLAHYRGFIVSLERAMEYLGIEGKPGMLLDPESFPEWETWAEDLSRRLEGLRRHREELERRRVFLGLLTLFLRRLSGLGGDFATLRSLHFVTLRLGLVPEPAVALIPLGPGTAVYPLGRIEAEILIVILTVRGQVPVLERELSTIPFTPVPLPAAVSGTFSEVLRRVRSLRQRIRRRLDRLDRRISDLRQENRSLLRDRRWTVLAECHLLEAGEDFDFTRQTVALGGWVPQRRYAELEKILQRVCERRFILRRAAARGEETPVLLSNPALVRPFQKLLSVYGTPLYGEVEPTPLLALGFLVLFGMMFGDLGQGLVLVGAGAALRRTRFRDEGSIVAQVGASAALFGLLFGSFFGREDLFPPIWFSPMQDIPRLMAVALTLGAGLIMTGLVLRIINGVRGERIAAVLTDRFGAAGLVFYAGSLATGFLVYSGVLPAAALTWLVIPLAAIFCHPFTGPGRRGSAAAVLGAEGAIEVLETVLGFFANTFSFLRVAAFGLAHVGLFMAVFAMADLVRHAPAGLLWAALVHVIGNLVILLLEGLVVSVQTVRLEFYEIFSKFFRGGGSVYRPLALESGSERRD